jgi:hypothetical protein
MRIISALLGLALGVVAGLYYAWLVSPVEYIDTAPDSLRVDFRDDYLALIGAAYASTGDLVRARARLALFPELDPAAELSAIAQQRLAAGLTDADALAQLAADLSRAPRSTLIPTATVRPGSPTPTRRPPTATPRPSATPGASFGLEARETICDPDLIEPLIQVEVFDAAGDPVPGVEVIVVWDTGQDHFFTGLKPELGVGYGDFSMTEGTSYTLQLQDSRVPVVDLSTHVCESEDGESYLGSWHLRYEQTP